MAYRMRRNGDRTCIFMIISKVSSGTVCITSSTIKAGENPELSIRQSLLSLVPGARIQIHQDYFMEYGPNGSYLCLVYQLAGPSILSMSFFPGKFEGSRRLRKYLAKKVDKQLACTVELMHNCGFVHGDLW